MIFALMLEGDMVNVTPVVGRFIGKFFVIFAVVAVIAILTPRIARRIDEFRAAHEKPQEPEDPRMKMVRGPYDMPEPPAPTESDSESDTANEE